LTARVGAFLDALTGDLQQVLEDVDAGRGGDSILAQLQEILEGRVTLPLSEGEWAECVAEGNRRIEAEQPPGYLDTDELASGPPEGGAGAQAGERAEESEEKAQ
jgi:hypothetical protein